LRSNPGSRSLMTRSRVRGRVWIEAVIPLRYVTKSRVRGGVPHRIRDYDDPIVETTHSWTALPRVRAYDDAVVLTAISCGRGLASSRFLQCEPLLPRPSPTPRATTPPGRSPPTPAPP